MKLIVISSPTPVYREAEIINQLFDSGLDIFHLRKSESTLESIEEILMNIKPQYYTKIAIHQHHLMKEEYNLRRLHFPEKSRVSLNSKERQQLQHQGYILSTSIHDLTSLPEVSDFNYTFYGPVFDSISKPGYLAALSEEFQLQNVGSTELIGLGGINESNILKLKSMQFSGAALLGTIWKNPEKAIDKFELVRKIWN